MAGTAFSQTMNRWMVFPSDLGWIAVVGQGRVVHYLTFGHSSLETAVAQLDRQVSRSLEPEDWNAPLMRQLQAFASGEPVDFRQVEVDLGQVTAFRRRILKICRAIPYGKTLTYGQIASRAGSPGAARAVGTCMASNRIPLIIPCHRVIAGNGGLGGFSAPGGIATKRRLLAMESGQRAPMAQMG